MRIRTLAAAALLIGLYPSPASPQQISKLGDNAALRYYAAFAEMQDFAISEEQAKELNGILDGTVPYRDSEYKDLVVKNTPALELMARGAALPTCDWGLDYDLGANTPVDYARNALALGRLNILHLFHLEMTHQTDAAVSYLVAGFRFSRDVANGGSLFATLVARSLLTNHLRVMAFLLHTDRLSPAQRKLLSKAIAKLGPTGLDWQSAAKRELGVLRGHFAKDTQASTTLIQIIPTYIDALNDPSKLPVLEQMLANAPRQVSEVIPKPKRVLQEKQDFSKELAQARSVLQ